MIIGYARVSTEDQKLDMQIQAIERYVEELNRKIKEENEINHTNKPLERLLMFSEHESGGKANRKELKKALDTVSSGDKFVIYKLDRLARSTKQLHEIAEDFKQNNIELVSLKENIDTSTSTGKMVFTMLSAIAEFERDLIRERTKDGLESARKKGHKGGRPPLSASQKKRIKTLFDSGERATDIAKEFSIGRSTVYKVVNEKLESVN